MKKVQKKPKASSSRKKKIATKKKVAKKPAKKAAGKRLRYRGRFIPARLEESIRDCHLRLWRKGRRVTYEKLLQAYFENRQHAIDTNFEDYVTDSICSIDELESGLEFIYYMFAARLRDVLADNNIKRPKFYVKRWGDDFYTRVSKVDLFIEKDEFLDRVWEAFSELEADGYKLDSPKYTFILVVLKVSEEVYLDINLTQNIPDEIKAILNNEE